MALSRLHTEGTKILHSSLTFESKKEFALWRRQRYDWEDRVSAILVNHFTELERNRFTTLGIFAAAVPEDLFAGDPADHRLQYRVQHRKLYILGEIIDRKYRG